MAPVFALAVESVVCDDVGVRIRPGIPAQAFEDRPALKTMVDGSAFELRRPDGSVVRTKLVTYGIDVRLGPDGALLVDGPPADQPILLTFAAGLSEKDIPPGTEVWYLPAVELGLDSIGQEHAGHSLPKAQVPLAREGPLTRQDDEPPSATQHWGWRYHHTGIPTREQRAGERYLPLFKMYVSGFPESPYGVEWMRFEPDSPIAEIIRTVPHVAFEVDDLEAALEGKTILSAPNSPCADVRVAMIVDNGCPIELIQFNRPA